MGLSKRNRWLLGIGLALAALGGAYLAVDALARQQLGVPVTTLATAAASARDDGYLSAFGPSGPDGTGPLFSKEERLAIAQEVGLDEKQRAAVAKIFSGPPPGGIADALDKLRQARAVVTPEQIRRAQEILPGRILERLEQRRQKARERLSPEEFAAYDRKYARLMEQLRTNSRDLMDRSGVK